MNWRFVMVVAAAGWLVACSEAPSTVEVPFGATYAGAPLACEGSEGVVMTDLRFYVHNLRLEDTNGQFHDIRLDVDDWQQSDLALLDLEDGGGSCMNGTTVENRTVRGTVTGTEFRALEFTLGVPFTKNHSDPLQATAPLGDADMHWHWRGGYKFLRAGVRNDTDSFWIHLGSTGCEGTIRNISGCNSPNRVTVRIDDFQLGDAVQIDLAKLVGDDTLADGTPTDCSSGPAEAGCKMPFASFGLNHATGAADGHQKIFTVLSKP